MHLTGLIVSGGRGESSLLIQRHPPLHFFRLLMFVLQSPPVKPSFYGFSPVLNLIPTCLFQMVTCTINLSFFLPFLKAI